MATTLVSDANARKCCLVQDVMLSDITKGIYPHDLQVKTYGTTQMLAAAEKVSGVIDVHTEKAKPLDDSRTVWEVAYKARRCTPATEEDCTDPFESIAAVINPWLYAKPVMGVPLHYEFAINMADYRSICQNSTSDLAERLRETYDALKGAANQRYIDQLQANLGNYFSTAADCEGAVDSATNPKSLHLMSTTGQPQPAGFYPLLNEYKRMGITQKPLMVGGTLLDALAWLEPVYTAGATNGSTLLPAAKSRYSNLPDIFIDYDIDIDYDDADQHAISMVPGAASRLFWNRFEGEHAYSSPTLVKRKFDLGAMFGDPGFIVDQSVAVIEGGSCDIKIIYKFYLYTDLFFIPSDAFNGTTCGQCSNYLLQWLLDCNALGCVDFSGPVTP